MNLGIASQLSNFLDKTIFLSVENRKEHFLNLILSGLYFAITFIAIHYIGHAWSTYNAHLKGYSPFFSYNGMDSLLGTTGWSPKRIAFIYLMPAATGILALIIGFIALRIARTKQVHLRTFMFWLSLNGLLMYMSYIATGYLSGVNFNSKFFTGFVGLYAWLFWKDITIYGVLLLQVLLCIPVLLYFGRLVLSLNYSSSLLKQKNGKFIIWINIVFIPFLIGVLIVIAATFPMEFGYQLVRILSFLPIAFIVAIGTQLFSTKHISIIKGGMKPLPIVLLAFGIGILILISRTVLSLSIGPLW